MPSLVGYFPRVLLGEGKSCTVPKKGENGDVVRFVLQQYGHSSLAFTYIIPLYSLTHTGTHVGTHGLCMGKVRF